jgi:hypothetical protein
MAKIGTITVAVFRASMPVDKTKAENLKDRADFDKAKISDVHEKALKGEAKSHGIS